MVDQPEDSQAAPEAAVPTGDMTGPGRPPAGLEEESASPPAEANERLQTGGQDDIEGRDGTDVEPADVEPAEVEPADVEPADVEIGLAAFLPEGVELDAGDDDDHTGDGPGLPDGDGSEPGVDGAGSTRPDQDDFDLELLDGIERDLDAVAAALTRLDQGTYGTCPVCDAIIDADVLEADPVSSTCGRHDRASQ